MRTSPLTSTEALAAPPLIDMVRVYPSMVTMKLLTSTKLAEHRTMGIFSGVEMDDAVFSVSMPWPGAPRET